MTDSRSKPGGVESIYRLTPTQEGILLHSIQGDARGLYFQQFTCELHGTLDFEDFASAWRDVVARHPALRALFTWEKREHPLQVVRRSVELPIEHGVDPEVVRGGPALEALLAQDRAAGFTIDKAPLLRLRVFSDHESGDRHRLLWSFHHLLLDGWSMRLVLDEVLATYVDARRGQPRLSPDAPPTFEKYVGWLRRQDAKAAQAYWTDLLAGFDAPTAPRLEVPPAKSASASISECPHRLGEDATARLSGFAKAQGLTTNTLLRGAWALLLSRYAGSDDVVFGATVAGRPPAFEGVERVVGMCINTIPVRAKIRSEDTVRDWLRGLQRQQLDSSEFETTALVDIQRWSDVSSGQALFDSILVFENLSQHEEPEDDPDAVRIVAPRYVEQSNYPLALLVVPGAELEWVLIHDPKKFGRRDIEGLARALATVLEAFAAQPDARVVDLPILDQHDAQRLEKLARNEVATPLTGATVIDQLDAVVAAHAEAPALRFAGEQMSYGALANRAAGVVDALRAAGAAPGDRVGLLLPRSRDTLVAIVGTLQAGCAYVPMDPTWPPERVRFVLEDTSAAAVLATTEQIAQRAADRGNVPWVAVDALTDGAPTPHHAIDPESTAYVIYTSGSTGRPKGVEISHRALAASTAARTTFYPQPVAKYLLLSPYHFDSSVAGIFWTLVSGGELVLPEPGAEHDPSALVELIHAARASHMLCLPSLYDALLDVGEARSLASLCEVIVAGEACPADLPAKHRSHLPNTALTNEYGPTEACVWATAARITEHDSSARLTIGRPVGDTEVHILDAHGQALPPGVAGELCIAGTQLSDGYLGQPERTATSFVARRLPGRDAPVRVYHTGDLARFRSDGTLAFLGRIDDQVKIRGHRVELGEIEAALTSHPTVEQAAVVLREQPRGAQLLAYVVGRDATPESLRQHLALTLPDALIPSLFAPLPAFPRTSTGKIDRRALPDVVDQAASDAAPIAARDATEAKIAAIWREVLGLDDISIDANFYELGGDSLQSIRILARAHRAGLHIDPARFAEDPTIAGAAAAVRREPEEVTAPRVDTEKPFALTPIQHWFFGLDLPDRSHWNMAVVLRPPRTATLATIRRALETLTLRHDALRLRFVSTPEGWQQQIADAAPFASEEHDLRGVSAEQRDAAVARIASEFHRSLDLERGPLFGAALFDCGEGDRRLLLAAHHLVVDAISWNILVDDLAAAHSAPAGAANSLAQNAFASWVQQLSSFAASEAFAAGLSELRQVAATAPATLPLDLPDGREKNSVDSAIDCVVSLDAAATAQLLHDVPPVYGTKIDDILLTAVSRALRRQFGTTTIDIDLESHGRGPHIDGVDLSRTVGWLTSVAPVRLELPADEDALGPTIKSVKEQLRQATQSFAGIGFALARALHPDRELRAELARRPTPDLLFNNLGQRKATPPDDHSFALLRDSTVGDLRATTGQRPHLVELNVHHDDDGLHMRWTYSNRAHRDATIRAAAEACVDELRAIIEHCRDPDAGGRTPSDFPMADLDQGDLDKLSDLLGE